jgi:triphosphatase
MVEVELKFQIHETRRNALLKALDPKKSESILLKAQYFDTEDRRLAQNHAAIRLRLEGTRWVQTLKAAGKSHIQRFEHNYDLGESELAPSLNLEIYKEDTEAKTILTNALGDNWDILQLQFETDIQRTLRQIPYEESQIEVSLDVGHIRTKENETEVHEVEFELKEGNIQNLLAFSFEWVKKYQLWLDVRSKAEIGNLLAQKQLVSPAQKAKDFQLSKKDSADKNVRYLIAQELQHLLPNIAAISASVGEQAHLDEAESALEHLYLTAHLFKEWSPSISEKWGYQLQAFKQQFENLKHFQHMKDTLGAFLQNPNTSASLERDILYAKEKLNNLVKSTLNVHHFLELLMFSLDEATTTQKNDLKWFAQTTLQNQYKQLHESLSQANISDFESLDLLSTHIRELKFSFPILTSIYDVKNLQKYSKALNDAQIAAKEYQILSSSAAYIQQTELEASDWFVLGWLTAKQEVYADKLVEATEQFMVSRKFLK